MGELGSGDGVALRVLADSTIDPLAIALAATVPTPAIRTHIGPYNQVVRILLDDAHDFWHAEQGLVLVWTRPEEQIPEFRKLLDEHHADTGRILDEAGLFADALVAGSRKAARLFALSWSLPTHARGTQGVTMRPGIGVTNTLMRMNLLLADRVEAAGNITLIDTQYWHAALDRPAHDPKFQALGKIRYSKDFFDLAARQIKALVRATRGESRKLIVCDLDNTLWGGVVGDAGVDGIKLGGHDPEGESFVRVQRELNRWKHRGVLLAISSKNEEETALATIEEHPEMVLRMADFAAWRINWLDKAANIAAIADELNLGLQSIVFLDDNPVERDRVRAALPEVLVPELPQHWSEYPSFISQLDCFETFGLSAEDAAKTQLYHENRERSESRKLAGSLDDWLQSLETLVRIEAPNQGNVARAVQLMNKTNQFNMSTRRMSEAELRTWIATGDREAFLFRVKDRFGDQGICGVITVDGFHTPTPRLADFFMSCRVMGRQVEDAMLHSVARQLAAEGAEHVQTNFEQTKKNKPFRDYIADLWDDATDQRIRLGKLSLPEHINIET